MEVRGTPPQEEWKQKSEIAYQFIWLTFFSHLRLSSSTPSYNLDDHLCTARGSSLILLLLILVSSFFPLMNSVSYSKIILFWCMIEHHHFLFAWFWEKSDIFFVCTELWETPLEFSEFFTFMLLLALSLLQTYCFTSQFLFSFLKFFFFSS